jgi:hypothetical protein
MVAASLRVGDLVARSSTPGEAYRVTSIHGTAAQGYVRLLPFRRAGGEVFIARHRGAWIDSGGKAWTKL